MDLPASKETGVLNHQQSHVQRILCSWPVAEEVYDANGGFTTTPEILILASWAIVAAQYEGSETIGCGLRGAHAVGTTDGLTAGHTPTPLDWHDKVRKLLLHADSFTRRRQNENTSTSDNSWNLVLEDCLHVRGKRLETRVEVGRHCGDDEVQCVRSPNKRTQVPSGPGSKLKVECLVEAGSVQSRFVYNSKDVDENCVKRLACQLQRVLQQICIPENEATELSEIIVTSEEDLREIWQWNSTVPVTADSCIHNLFAAQVDQNRDAPAIDAWDGQMTYGQLDEESTKLAAYLVGKLKVARGSFIPLCFEKSKWYAVAVFGVMKAGGASVALDPSNQPEERLRIVLDQLNSAVVLSSFAKKSLARRLTDHSERIVVVDEVQQNQRQVVSASATVLPDITPSDRLYINFTSGSTGQPKGVIITHSNFCSAIQHQQQYLGIKTSTRVFDFTSYTFDVTWINTLFTLTAGACLCVPNEADRLSNLQSSIQHYRANYIQLTPSVFRTLKRSDVPCLETVALGGEVIKATQLAGWQDTCKLFNCYGPAECTPTSTLQSISPNHPDDPAIGRGRGLATWVVNPNNQDQLAPVGCKGELWLEGPLVGEGYLFDDEKTRATFVHDPRWLLSGTLTQPGRRGRLYRTGDIVRYDSSGCLEYIGREDSQVKVRGQRVELAEVEFHIQRSLDETSRTDVVAEMVFLHGTSHPSLVAFLCSHNDDTETVEQPLIELTRELSKRLDEQLGAKLPNYMIPSFYISLPSMPTTLAGKIDRVQLRQLLQSMTKAQLIAMRPSYFQEARRSPLTATETILQQLWANVLDIDAGLVTASDSFLKIGGDSITMIKLVGLAAKEHGLFFTVADVFLHPVLRQLATVVSMKARIEDNQITPFSLLSIRSSFEQEKVCFEVAEQCGIQRSQVVDILPCTPTQEGLIALTTRRRNAYVSSITLELLPEVELDRFKYAWTEVMKMTPILRTRIVALGEIGVVQVVVDEHISELAEPSAKVTPMGLNTRLLQWSLVTDDKGTRLFVCQIHHALYDAWSWSLMLENLTQTYMDHARPQTAPFPIFLRYAQNVVSNKAAKEFWQEQFLGLEVDPFPQIPSQSYQPLISESESRLIRGLGWLPQTDITPSTIIRAAWSILMASRTAQRDVLFGAVSTGRQAPVPCVERMIGPTIATVPVRICVLGSTMMDAFLEGIQKQAIRMVEFEQMGLHNIWRLDEAAERACQFQTLLVIQTVNVSSSQAMLFKVCSDWEQETEQEAKEFANFNTYALIVHCTIAKDQLKLRMSYDPNVVSLDQIERMTLQLEHIVKQICSPECLSKSVEEVETISKSDLSAIWRMNKVVPATVQDCMHDLINKTCYLQPDAQAIAAWDGNLTYAELHGYSDHLAHSLVNLGVSRGAIIPLCFEKSKWTAVAMLAVMKAGGASVPLDSSQPDDRLRAIVEQVHGASVETLHKHIILSSTTNRHLASCLSPTATVINVDSDTQQSQIVHNSALPNVVPSDLLYVVFTSGSTGTPKGVMITHSNFCSQLKYQPDYGLDETMRVFDITSYAFDAAWALFCKTLTVGGCLCIPKETNSLEILLSSANTLKANTFFLTPSLARLIDPSLFVYLRYLLLAGEPVTKADVARWSYYGGAFVGYGPAECSAMATSTTGPLSSDFSIGNAVGCVAWIVDIGTGNRLVPFGVTGELWLEGPIVGLGYLSDPEQTASSFIQDPVWLSKGIPGISGRRGRLYRTGDLVRYDKDSSLVFVGRKDTQVKIRGQRVELSEIEHHIRSHLGAASPPEVIAQIIVPKGSQLPTLVIFITNHASTGALEHDFKSNIRRIVSDVHQKIAESLPSYMLPTAYIPIANIFMTATGKTDHRRLRELGESLSPEQLMTMSPTRSEHRQAVSSMEIRLRDIWARVLRVDAEKISIDDRFIRIGGDSISAMRVVSSARKDGLDISITDILNQKTLGDLAHCTQELIPNGEALVPAFSLLGGSSELTAIKSTVANLCAVPVELIEDILPCTPLQIGLVTMTDKYPGAYISQNKYELKKAINVPRFWDAWRRVVDLTPVLRTRIVYLEGEGFLQVVIEESWTTLDFEIQIEGSTEFNSRFKNEGFGLGSRLSHYGIIPAVNDGGVTFELILHHAVYDGWSQGIMLNLVEQIYHNQSVQLTTPFSLFIKHLTDVSGDEKAIQFWESQFEGSEAIAFPVLPRASYRPRANTTSTYSVQDLRWFRSDVTHSSMIRAAWAIVVSGYTSLADTVFGVIVTGRQAPIAGIESMIGPTIAAVPVRITLDYGRSISHLLEQVHLQSTNMVAFEQIGLQRIERITDGRSRLQTLLVIQDLKTGAGTHSEIFRCPTEEDDAREAEVDLGVFNTYALVLEFTLQETGLLINSAFDSEVITGAEIDRLMQQFQHVLRQLCLQGDKNQSRDLRKIDLVDQEDLTQIWNWNVSVPATVDRLVHDLILDRTRLQPEAVAVHSWDGELTYQELDSYATDLAQYITQVGLCNGNQVIVPLLFEKSKWTIVAMLGVMKAGGASVVLDISQPIERLRLINLQVQSPIVLSSAACQHMAQKLGTSSVIVVDAESHSAWGARLMGVPNVLYPPKIKSSSYLYLVFTSGSTGTPKGVVITHANFASAIEYQQKALGYRSTSRVFDVHSHAFDAIWATFCHTLTAGGCICIPEEIGRWSDFSASINKLEANFCVLTPSFARAVNPDALSLLKTLTLTGEAVLQEDVSRWSDHAEVLVVYGPAECSCAATIAWTNKKNEPSGIGRGAGTVTWIVDSVYKDRLVPIGSIGEMWLEGPLVGLGYHNDPDKTAATFFESPEWLRRDKQQRHHGRNSRFYATGDLVRYRVDGSLEFIGREDSQVKVRGQRVDLGEVEHHIRTNLSSLEDLSVVVEVVLPLKSSDGILVAFLNSGTDLVACTSLLHRLEDLLADNLPGYMLPSTYLSLDSIPLTSSGKTDRRRLREIGGCMTLEQMVSSNLSKTERREPSTIVEIRLQHIWARVLGVKAKSISATDSFLRIGGDSIAAMRLVSVARTENIHLTVADIFKRPQLYQLAEVAIPVDIDRCKEVVDVFSLLNLESMSLDEVCSKASIICGVDQMEIQDIYPCTPLQVSLLAMTTKRGGAYVARHVLEIHQDAALDMVRQSLDIVFSRFGILRTRIIELPLLGMVQVVIGKQQPWVFSSNLQAYLDEDSRMDMGLGTSLCQLALVEDGLTSKRFLVWTIHHALYDGYSIELLMKEVEIASQVVLDGNNHVGQDLIFPQATFSTFVRHLAKHEEKKAGEFWKSQAESIQATSFPPLPSLQYQPNANLIHKHRIQGLKWPIGDTMASASVRAAVSLLLSIYTSSDDVLFGTIISGRQVDVIDIDKIIGPTIATVPLRVRLDQQSTIEQFLKQIQAQAIDMIAFEHTGLQRIKKFDANTEELTTFQTLLILHPPVVENDKRDGSRLFISTTDDQYTDPTSFSTYALTIVARLEAEGLQLDISTDKEVMDIKQVQRLTSQLELILRQLCSGNNDQILKDLNHMSADDLSKIWSWNSYVPEVVGLSVNSTIETLTYDRPHAPAICSWDGDLTYQDLNILSTRLAAHLIYLGIGKGKVVPLLFEKSMWMPVTALAVIKSGAACVALDSKLPIERLKSIVLQASSKYLLSSTKNLRLGEKLQEGAVLAVDNRLLDDLTSSKHVSSISFPEISPKDWLYVVFTSGSTGVPKGAIITHENFSSAVHHQQISLNIQATSRVYDFVPYSFDVSWSNLLQTLCAGGCLCIPSEEDIQSNITQSMQAKNVNFAHMTPSVARILDPTDVSGLQTLCLIGEPMTAEDVNQWTPHVRLVNTYGPAECTVTSTIQEISTQELGVPSIGRGVGCVPWIVDPEDHDRLVPIGVIGELLLEGPIVGVGYLNDDAKTAAAFIHTPLWLRKGTPGVLGREARLYKTGDLARYKGNGVITYEGRKDTQFKIHGQRVESGDIEHHLSKILSQKLGRTVPIVVESITPADGSGAFLTAFIARMSARMTPEIESDSSTVLSAAMTGVEKILSEKLPLHMIPRGYVFLESIPLTATGKADRNHLRLIGQSRTMDQLTIISKERRREPSSPAERYLQQQWSSILDIRPQQISADDSFLHIGGDSIAAMRLVSAVRDYPLYFTVADVFRYSRLSQLAMFTTRTAPISSSHGPQPFTLINTNTKNRIDLCKQAAKLCNITSGQVEDIMPCTPLQEGMLTLTEKRSGDYISSGVLELNDSVTLLSFKDAWTKLVQIHPILRTRIIDVPQLGFVQVAIAEHTNWYHLGDSNFETSKKETMGLGTRLVHAKLEQDHAAGKSFFSWTMHHAIYDQWSLSALFQDLEHLMLEKTLPPSTPFSSFVKHLALANDNLSAAKFWRQQMTNLEAEVFPRLPSTSYQPYTNSTQVHEIKEIQWPITKATSATMIKASFSILLSRHTDVDDVVFGTITSGRQTNLEGIDRVIGPTVAAVPVRVRLSQEQTISELLSELQEQYTEMIAFEQTGLQYIRRFGDEPKRSCLFQSLLGIQPAERNHLGTEGLFLSQDSQRQNEEFQVSIGGFNTYAMMFECLLGSDSSSMSLRVSFDSNVVSKELVGRLVQQFDHILEQICSMNHETTPVASISVISKHDMTDIWTWNANVPKSSGFTCIHDLISVMARQQPEKLAIAAWDGQFTYQELDEQSTLIAHHLLQLSIGKGSIVPLCFEKSRWTSVAILGVMKTGAASVVMDSDQPQKRLQTIVNQISASVILASIANEDLAKSLLKKAKVVLPESLVKEVKRSSEETNVTPVMPLFPVTEPSDALYFVFTSGSTGTPKGAIVSHGNFYHSVQHQQEGLGFDSGSRTFDFQSYAFDLVWMNFCHTLTAGGCLCVPSDVQRMEELASTTRFFNANHCTITPSLSRIIAPDDLPHLTTVLLGGEMVTKSDVARWISHPGARIVYGPAECSPISTILKLGDVSNYSFDSIGRGAGTVTWVLDSNGDHLAPLGSVGELWLESPMVGAGYHQDAIRTSAAFIDNPKWLLKGGGRSKGREGRLYKTGDLVKYNSDGSLAFVARNNTQVKLRGQRLDLEEVEHHIQKYLTHDSKHIGVVALLITPLGSDAKLLVAFVCPDLRHQESHTVEGTRAAVEFITRGLNDRLGDVLPHYMVPNAYLPMTALPMTATGKTDRRRLQAMGNSWSMEQLGALNVVSNAKSRPLDTPTEILLQALWAKVLNIRNEVVGANDNFFGLGGDSIAAMRLVRLAREESHLFTISDVFKNPRLCDLASISTKVASSTDEITKITPFTTLPFDFDINNLDHYAATLCHLQASAVVDVLPVTDFQNMCLVANLLTPPLSLAYMFMDLPDGVDIMKVEDCCSKLWGHLEMLRTVFIRIKDDFYQVVTSQASPAVTVLNSNGDLDQVCQELCDAGLTTPIQLGTFITHFTLVITPHHQNRLLIKLSHAQYDALSLAELVKCFAAYYEDQSPSIYPSFSTVIRHGQAQKHSGFDHWHRTLHQSDMTEVRSKSSVMNQPKATISTSFTAREIIPAPDVPKGYTPAILLTAFFACILGRMTNSTDIVFALVSSGRAGLPSEIQNTPGPCVTDVPIRIQFSDRDYSGLSAVLESVRRQQIEGMQYQMSRFKDIAHAAGWPTSTTHYKCLVQFQNIDETPSVDLKTQELKLDVYNANQFFISDLEVLVLFVTPVGNQWAVDVHANGTCFSQKVVDRVMHELRGLIEGLI